jgi:uncharacterized UBP type Zn finger protein
MAMCEHLEAAPEQPPPATTPEGCEECLAHGGRWVHLRLCLTCGHVGCCDSSPGKHASAHGGATEHPVITSWEPGETWRWCFVDDRGRDPKGTAARDAAEGTRA